ncbi:sugar-phosphatase [Nitrospirillum amazonense]|uniref:Sugar-phosphatase n=1 Tax=Nitrospirillum amazonense TaxID=28077 RepID=A0A560ES97_9PROT|nr:HAD-IA family hydrolase [Nitrospirillum amazonense]TWB12253.1 sugar-phosphatase [Nitrospirillum amazonense]
MPAIPHADRTFAAFLFDMDGTLIDSIAAANRAWSRWATRHGLDPAPILATMHGVRAVETIRRWAPPGTDVEAEVAQLTRDEIDDVAGTVAIPGAAAVVANLPPARWAVVTSAPRALAQVRLRAAGLTPPPVIVTAEDVSRGKPAPDPFLLAARQLEVAPRDCLVWEDAPAGIAAGEAAGAAVAVITATHHQPLDTAHPKVPNYERLKAVLQAEDRLRLTVRG